MIPETVRLPFYAKLTLLLLMLCLLFLILYVGRDIIMPLLVSLLFALVLRPIVVFMNEKLKFPNVVAVLVSVILFVVLIGCIIFFISSQVSDFANDLPQIKQRLSQHYQQALTWTQKKFNISSNNQEKYILQLTQNNGSQLLGSTLNVFSQTFLHITIIPIFTFLILLYRNLFKKFLNKLIDPKNHGVLFEIVQEVKNIIQSYILGLLIEMGIVATLTSVGLALLGIPYAILLGVIAGVLNLVPYLGILCATVLAAVSAFISSSDASKIIGAILIVSAVNFIDNNFVVPKIVASKVRINALVSIIGVFVGGMLAGTMGMFIALPFIAILKVIFDRIKELEPWGFLMSDDLPKTYKWGIIKLPALNAGREETNSEEKKAPEK